MTVTSLDGSTTTRWVCARKSEALGTRRLGPNLMSELEVVVQVHCLLRGVELEGEEVNELPEQPADVRVFLESLFLQKAQVNHAQPVRVQPS